MGSSQHIALVVVGRGALISGAPQRIERYIIGGGAGWILVGLPALSELVAGGASTASVQWCIGGAGCRIGDAALARDSVSGQGLSLGITDAMCAASSLREHGDFDLLHQRQVEQRHAHIQSLGNAIRSSHFASELTWRNYSEFLDRHSQTPESGVKVALRDGRLSIQQA
jgi:flavin-dependent dehydrogenase